MACQGRRIALRAGALFLSMIVIAEIAAAATLTVGGKAGWNLGVNFAAWAASTPVKPNDSLLFNYDPNFHSVLEVTKPDFDACKISASKSTHGSGKDIIKITKPGTYYFICGIGGHCGDGMKVAITV